MAGGSDKSRSPTRKDIAVDFGLLPRDRLNPERLVEQPTKLANWIKHFLRQSTTTPLPEELISALKLANDRGIEVKAGRDEALPTARDLMLALGVHWALTTYYGAGYVDDADESLLVDGEGKPIGEEGSSREKMDVACLKSANRLNDLFSTADESGARRFTAEEVARLVYRARRSASRLAREDESGALGICGISFGPRDMKKPRKTRPIR